MLSLTRRVGESVLIGDGITIMVAGVSATQARIAIDAPKYLRVDRQEVAAKLGPDFVRDQRAAPLQKLLARVSVAADVLAMLGDHENGEALKNALDAFLAAGGG